MTNSPATATALLPAQYGEGVTASPGLMTPYTSDSTEAGGKDQPRQLGGSYDSLRKSTLPSVLELEHLTKGSKKKKRKSKNKNKRNSQDPFAENLSPDLMTPAAQQRLGRMSVAPARYRDEDALGLPQEKRPRGSRSPDSSTKRMAAVPVKTIGGMSRFYQTWRPFVNPGLGLVSALLLTISLQNNPGPLSRYLKVPGGTFTVTPRGVTDVGLGVNGWCPLTGRVHSSRPSDNVQYR
jgi:hypothetical protein